MKLIKLLALTIIFSACNQTNKTDNKPVEQEFLDSIKFEKPTLTECKPQQIILDTSTYLNNKIIYPDSTIAWINVVALNTSNDIGYAIVVYQDQEYLCLINYPDKDFIIVGVARLNSISKNMATVDFCQSSCSDNSICSAFVIEEKVGKVKTIKAWRVNADKRTLEAINPNAVDCTTSFYTDYD
jgi:hypothetical protein